MNYLFVNHITFFQFMSTVRTAVLLDEKVNKDIQNAIYKPRKHPGVMKYKNVQLPIEYIKAMENSIQGSNKILLYINVKYL